MVVRFIVFLTSATLIFRGTVISKCFRESLGIRDNKSRLYVVIKYAKVTSMLFIDPNSLLLNMRVMLL